VKTGRRKREVDIRVEAEVHGHPIYIGIEVSASKSRKKTVEWVERMQGKHSAMVRSKVPGVLTVDKPLDARSYRSSGSGKKLVIVPEGSSDK
jgi:hypothetical protein